MSPANKRRATSHIPRTLNSLARGGYDLHEKVERWVSWAPVGERRMGNRSDLFGIGDILAANIDKRQILIVQVCSESSMSAHRKKVATSESLAMWLLAGGAFALASWRKDGHRWSERVQKAEMRNAIISWKQVGGWEDV